MIGKGVQTNMTSSNNLVNPNAREAMDRFKMEAASEVGVNLKQGYNGDLTSKQAGSVDGQMVKNVCPVIIIIIETLPLQSNRSGTHSDRPLHSKTGFGVLIRRI